LVNGPHDKRQNVGNKQHILHICNLWYSQDTVVHSLSINPQIYNIRQQM